MSDDELKSCRLCGESGLELVYSGMMRHSGCRERKDTGHKVYACKQCGVEQISPFPMEPSANYEDGTYWKENKGAGDILESIHVKALAEGLQWLNKIGTTSFAGKVVVDFGCGTGAFLDLIGSVAAQTVAIEADPNLAEHVASKGHTVFTSLQEAIESGIAADVVCSFDVLEHLANPIVALRELGQVLRDGGLILIGVPNQADCIKALVPDYLGHFYHVEHLWYFSEQSLQFALKQAGYDYDTATFLHKYNFMNLIEWARTGQAPGLPESKVVDADLDSRLNGWLEDRGVASHILVAANRR